MIKARRKKWGRQWAHIREMRIPNTVMFGKAERGDNSKDLGVVVGKY
jgi:hypothetical protein